MIYLNGKQIAPTGVASAWVNGVKVFTSAYKPYTSFMGTTDNPHHFTMKKSKVKAKTFTLSFMSSFLSSTTNQQVAGIAMPKDLHTMYRKSMTTNHGAAVSLTIWWNNNTDFIIRIDEYLSGTISNVSLTLGG